MLKTSLRSWHYCYPIFSEPGTWIVYDHRLLWTGADSPTFDSSQFSWGTTGGDQVSKVIFLLRLLLWGLYSLLWGARENEERLCPELRSFVGDWISKVILRLRALQREMETAEETIGTIWCPSSKLYKVKLCFHSIKIKWQLVTLSGRKREKHLERKTSPFEAYCSFICSPVPLSIPSGRVLEGKAIPPLPTL